MRHIYQRLLQRSEVRSWVALSGLDLEDLEEGTVIGATTELQDALDESTGGLLDDVDGDGTSPRSPVARLDTPAVPDTQGKAAEEEADLELSELPARRSS